ERNEDPKLAELHNLLKQKFCDAPLGRSLNSRLLDDHSRVLMPTHAYSFEIEYDLPDEDGVRARDELKVFVGLHGLGTALWDREIHLLRRLSTLNMSALPQVREGGAVQGSRESAAGPEEFAFLRMRRSGRSLDRAVLKNLRRTPERAMREAGHLIDALA